MNASRIRASRITVVAATSAATIVLLVACRGNDGDGAQAGSSAPPAAAAMTPGMVMSDGSTMGPAMADRPAASAHEHDTAPSSTATMVCSTEVRRDIATVLKLSATPAGTSRWAHHTYTCSYQLPMGTLVLTVHESSDPATALRYTRSTRHSLPGADRLAGLTPSAFGTTDGRVVLVKDADTLIVDATGLPARFGTEGQKRSDFAYELASDILGCWTGDDS